MDYPNLRVFRRCKVFSLGFFNASGRNFVCLLAGIVGLGNSWIVCRVLTSKQPGGYEFASHRTSVHKPFVKVNITLHY